MQCKLCRSLSNFMGKLLVLSKHEVSYSQCTECGFIQTEEPYWLPEAYSQDVSRQDVGALWRNGLNAPKTAALLKLVLPHVKHALDFGGGPGVFVRMMRDRGFDFHWRDKYAANHFANGFEYDPKGSYDFLTAFEVLEHFVDPMMELEEMMGLAPDVFVSTEVVPTPVPGLGEWWYFAPLTGQHIALYTRKSLEVIAKRFDRHLLSRGPYHLFSKKRRSEVRFGLAMRPRVAGVVNLVVRRPGLVGADFEKLAGQRR